MLPNVSQRFVADPVSRTEVLAQALGGPPPHPVDGRTDLPRRPQRKGQHQQSCRQARTSPRARSPFRRRAAEAFRPPALPLVAEEPIQPDEQGDQEREVQGVQVPEQGAGVDGAQHQERGEQSEVDHRKAAGQVEGAPVGEGARPPRRSMLANEDEPDRDQDRGHEAGLGGNADLPPAKQDQIEVQPAPPQAAEGARHRRRGVVVDRQPGAGERAGDQEIARKPQAHGRGRGQRDDGGPPSPLPRRRVRLNEQSQPHGHRYGHADVLRLPSQRAAHRRPRQRRGPAFGQELVGPDERQDRQQDERGVGKGRHRPEGQRRQGDRETGPCRQKAGSQAPPQIAPHDGDGQPEESGVERPGHVQRIECPQARRGQQQRVERGFHVRAARVVGKALAGQQAPGGGDVVDGVVVERHPVGELA